MPRARRLALSLLRRTFMVLLLVSIVVRPVMGDMATLHAAEHSTRAAMAAEAGLASHDHHDHERAEVAGSHGHAHADSDTLATGDHASGAHAVMHYGVAGASSVAQHFSMEVPLLRFGMTTPPPSDPIRPGTRLTSPFRPPIA